MNDTGKLCLHTITTRPWTVETAAVKYAAAGLGGISVWREALEGRDPRETGRMLRGEGLEIVSLVRGGFFAHRGAAKRREAIGENRRALEEASALGAPLLVLVCGADPDQTPGDSRKQIFEGILSLVPFAESLGVRLGIEPLHPMYADTRSAVNTLKQATDMAVRTGSERVGVVVDVYHLWWDPDLEAEILRCGAAGRLFAFHLSDWKVPTADLLNDREIMGRGCIPIPLIRQWVEAAGFRGFDEVEIFSEHYWAGDQDRFLSEIVKAYNKHS